MMIVSCFGVFSKLRMGAAFGMGVKVIFVLVDGKR